MNIRKEKLKDKKEKYLVEKENIRGMKKYMQYIGEKI